MESRADNAGVLIAKILVFAILLLVVIRVAAFLLNILGWLVGFAISLAIVAVIAWGIYYVLFRREANA